MALTFFTDWLLWGPADGADRGAWKGQEITGLSPVVQDAMVPKAQLEGARSVHSWSGMILKVSWGSSS